MTLSKIKPWWLCNSATSCCLDSLSSAGCPSSAVPSKWPWQCPAKALLQLWIRWNDLDALCRHLEVLQLHHCLSLWRESHPSEGHYEDLQWSIEELTTKQMSGGPLHECLLTYSSFCCGCKCFAAGRLDEGLLAELFPIGWRHTSLKFPVIAPCKRFNIQHCSGCAAT